MSKVTRENIEIEPIIEKVIASQFGKGINKRLSIEVDIVELESKYLVTIDRIRAYFGQDLDEALKIYNSGIKS